MNKTLEKSIDTLKECYVKKGFLKKDKFLKPCKDELSFSIAMTVVLNAIKSKKITKEEFMEKLDE